VGLGIEKLSRRVKYRDQVPTPEQLSRMMELADLRGRVIVSLAALGGFWEETLTRLEYRHVGEDVEPTRFPSTYTWKQKSSRVSTVTITHSWPRKQSSTYASTWRIDAKAQPTGEDPLRI